MKKLDIILKTLWLIALILFCTWIVLYTFLDHTPSEHTTRPPKIIHDTIIVYMPSAPIVAVDTEKYTHNPINVMDSLTRYAMIEIGLFVPNIYMIPESVWQQLIKDCYNKSLGNGNLRYLELTFTKGTRVTEKDFAILITSCLNTTDQEIINIQLNKFSRGERPTVADVIVLYKLSKNPD